MKKGDLVEWNYGKYRLRGVILEGTKWGIGWKIYFPSSNKTKVIEASALRKLQETL